MLSFNFCLHCHVFSCISLYSHCCPAKLRSHNHTILDWKHSCWCPRVVMMFQPAMTGPQVSSSASLMKINENVINSNALVRIFYSILQQFCWTLLCPFHRYWQFQVPLIFDNRDLSKAIGYWPISWLTSEWEPNRALRYSLLCCHGNLH